MRITFITFAPLHTNAGHLARLKTILPFLQNNHAISIINLGQIKDTNATKREFRLVNFTHIPTSFEGWNIRNPKSAYKIICHAVAATKPDIALMCMEVWDLMRDLPNQLPSTITFATIVHAMPFLGSPLSPTQSFESDVRNYLLSAQMPPYRKKYILQHYTEAPAVLKHNIIANNETVHYYLQNYFPGHTFLKLKYSFCAKVPNLKKRLKKYDFAFMARMEPGKGLEFLPAILKVLSRQDRALTIAILGITDSAYCNTYRTKIESLSTGNIRTVFFGWADDKLKHQVLSQAKVFIYPSIYDNYPTVIQEALAHALPCVMWDTPALSIGFKSLKYIQPVPLLNCEEFARTSLKLLDKSDGLSKRILKYLKTTSTPAQTAKADMHIFKSLLS